jgi:maltooligosyltrehalose trehalohydrolase
VALDGKEKGAQAFDERLTPEGNGYWSGFVAGTGAGTLYRYRLDDGAFPDMASRFQPQGPYGSSQIIDPSIFVWSDAEWRGITREGQVIYEMHIGTFSREGTWEAATAQLSRLAELGVRLLEVMPIADFPGRFGWGYDGVNLFDEILRGSQDFCRGRSRRAHTGSPSQSRLKRDHARNRRRNFTSTRRARGIGSNRPQETKQTRVER